MSRHSKANRKRPFQNLNRRLNLETLEDRSLPSCVTVSGFVYYDINNNGLYEMDLGETPIANSTIELHDANNDVVGTTTTDADGFYKFETDMLHPTLDSSLTETVSFGPTQTNFSLQGILNQFDPSLGQLQSIEIVHAGSITSEIQVENFSADSESDISGTVSGTLTLNAPGLMDVLDISGYAGSFHAGTYDGDTDFAGTSGESFGEQTAEGANSLFLFGSDMDAYVGTGTVDVTEDAIATSNATGGGNLDVRVRSTGQSELTVIYHYLAYDCLQPGDYTIIQDPQPDGYLDGKEAMDGLVDENSIGTDIIFITLNDTDLVNNNFGELMQTQISGHVWHDANNDGFYDTSSEAPIPGTLITLDGPTGSMQTTTDDTGYYAFTNLDPGTYTLRETQPDGYLDGMDVAGTLGGNVVNDPAEDQIQDIMLMGGDNSENNDFGEILPSSIAGHVWHDANDDGVFDAGESPIGNVTITLTGFDDQGPVDMTMQTNGSGEYKFENLRPGTYAINETQPAGYDDGQDVIGTPGGNAGNDVFDTIELPEGFDGENNDFGEIRDTPPPPPTPIPKDQGLVGFLPIISKTQRTNLRNFSNIDPVLRGQMAFIVATQVTLVAHQPTLAEVYADVQRLRAGTTQGTYVQNLWATNAHRAVQASQIYRNVLERMPTAFESAQVVAQLQGGATENDVAKELYVSAEYQTLHATQESLAIALYEDILNVTPGGVETQDLIQAMDTQPLDTVVQDLLSSDAAVANQIDNTYRKTVRRAATASEIQTWAPQIQGGTITLDELAQRLLSSQEFYILAYNKIK